MRKTWCQKLEDKSNFPKILTLQKGFPCYNAVHKMGAKAGDKIILVNPSEIMPLMAKVPKGKVTTLNAVCQALAHKHKVKGCCTLTTGIFIMTAANATAEALAKGDKTVLAKIPYWRTLKAEGYLNDKYPGGQAKQKRLLQKEGIEVITRGKKYQVADFEQFLAKL